jgi:hypothetical protein
MGLITGFLLGSLIFHRSGRLTVEEAISRSVAVDLYKQLRIAHYLENHALEKIQDMVSESIARDISILSSLKEQKKLSPHCLNALERGIEYQKRDCPVIESAP